MTPWWPAYSTRARTPDLNELAAQGIGETMYYAFPHYFVLPMYSSATSYRFFGPSAPKRP